MDLYDFVESQELKRPFAAVLQHRGIAPVQPHDVGYTMQFSDMKIAWRDEEYHWRFVEDEGRKVAHCQDVCWLSGTVRTRFCLFTPVQGPFKTCTSQIARTTGKTSQREATCSHAEVG